MPLELQSGCKINLLLNILGKRPDGFHELETLMHPVSLFDRLTFDPLPANAGIALTCSHPGLKVDETNLVYRAAALFLKETGIPDGIKIHLNKNIPMEAGLGGGSGNAATALLGLNSLHGNPLPAARLSELAGTLGSDVPFFLQHDPALAFGRGEKIESLAPFKAMQGAAMLLIRPGFGIATAWAYRALAAHPQALNGTPGRARELAESLQQSDLKAAGPKCYNSLEAPALVKFPLLAMLKEFLTLQGAPIAMMSGSGSTMFGIFMDADQAAKARELIVPKFGPCWTEIVKFS